MIFNSSQPNQPDKYEMKLEQLLPSRLLVWGREGDESLMVGAQAQLLYCIANAGQ